MANKSKKLKVYWKVTLWYLVFGAVWIFVSDRATEVIFEDNRTIASLQTLKGLFYVSASGLLIFFLTRAAFERQHRNEVEKLSVFKQTVEGSHHILLNYLNQMQLVTMEAERSADFDREILAWARDALDEASAALRRLDAIAVVSPEEINSALYLGPKAAGGADGSISSERKKNEDRLTTE